MKNTIKLVMLGISIIGNQSLSQTQEEWRITVENNTPHLMRITIVPQGMVGYFEIGTRLHIVKAIKDMEVEYEIKPKSTSDRYTYQGGLKAYTLALMFKEKKGTKKVPKYFLVPHIELINNAKLIITEDLKVYLEKDSKKEEIKQEWRARLI